MEGTGIEPVTPAMSRPCSPLAVLIYDLKGILPPGVSHARI